MIADGRLPRPQRDIRFWWVDEVTSEYQYFADHPEERDRILANINQDMVGARQSLGGRVQHISRTPYSRWSYLNDVVESIVTSLARGNNAYLASWQNKNPVPYSRPIFARLGSHEPYGAQVVPYFDSTDHMVFNEAAIGIPGVDFTNWPDPYIHSTGDDLWQIDTTQLQRNAVAVAATALYLANLSDADIPTLASVVAGSARERISRDLVAGLTLIAQAAEGEKNAALLDAEDLVVQATDREITGLNSLGRFAGERNQRLVDAFIADLASSRRNLKRLLEEQHKALGGSWPPQLFNDERGVCVKVPRNVGSLGEYLRSKDRVEGPKGLHGLMQWEALNYVDGQRSIRDIYLGVRAESLSVGEWYYGTVKLEDIEALFSAAEKEKAVEIVTKPM
jgi:hypothetical protein